ncbi:MAG: replicative DNA helicase [Bacteroidales bacterium]|nr:replicative DNA helicase [Bacteroidales bacterium]
MNNIERGFLACLMLRPESLIPASTDVRQEYFESPDAGSIFGAISDLYADGKPIDEVTIVERLRTNGTLALVGGAVAVSGVRGDTYTTAGFDEYKRLILRDYRVSRIRRAAEQIALRANEPIDDASELSDYAARVVFDAIGDEDESAPKHISESVGDVAREIHAFVSGEGRSVLIPTGVHGIDNIIGGVAPGQMIILAARPSVGKSALATLFAENFAIDSGAPVIIFSLEMPASAIVKRMIFGRACVKQDIYRNGGLRTKDLAMIAEVGEELSKAGIVIDDSSTLTLSRLRTIARTMVKKHKAKVIIVDYLQLMDGDGNRESRQVEVSRISRGLKSIARDLNVAVIALSQLNRQVEHREDQMPKLADLRESGSLEQDADIVMLLQRQTLPPKTEDDQDRRGEAIIAIAKHRNGPTGSCKLSFHQEYCRYSDYLPD